MTLHSHATTARTPVPVEHFRLPDIPECEPDEVTQFDQLFRTGLSHALAAHLGTPKPGWRANGWGRMADIAPSRWTWTLGMRCGDTVRRWG